MGLFKKTYSKKEIDKMFRSMSEIIASTNNNLKSVSSNMDVVMISNDKLKTIVGDWILALGVSIKKPQFDVGFKYKDIEVTYRDIFGSYNDGIEWIYSINNSEDRITEIKLQQMISDAKRNTKK